MRKFDIGSLTTEERLSYFKNNETACRIASIAREHLAGKEYHVYAYDIWREIDDNFMQYTISDVDWDTIDRIATLVNPSYNFELANAHEQSFVVTWESPVPPIWGCIEITNIGGRNYA